MFVEELDGPGTAAAEAAVDVHVAVGGHLVETLRQLCEWNQDGTRDPLLVPFPRLAHIEENSVASLHRLLSLLGSRLVHHRHGRSIRIARLGRSRTGSVAA